MDRNTGVRIYRDYDREELDRQYNCRARVADFEALLSDWRARSELFRRREPGRMDLDYGPGERERLDVFPPENPPGAVPALVFFHGGYWQALDKSVFHFMGDGLTRRGIAVVFVNYPLAPAASMDEIVASCRRSVTWLQDHCEELRIDPNRLFVSGHSAGGQIVAMLMAETAAGPNASIPPGGIKGGIALSGLFDLEPIRLTYLNEALGLDKAAARRNSPVCLEPAGPRSLLVAVGERESEEFHRQSREFTGAWSSKAVPVELIVEPDAHHFSILDRLSSDASPLGRAVSRLLG